MVWLVAATSASIAAWRIGRTVAAPDRVLSGTGSNLRAVIMLGQFFGSLLLIAVPSLISGCDDRELVELGALLQSGIGWTSPVPYPVLGALSVVALFAVVLIVAFLSTLGLRAVGLVLVGAAFLLALVLPTLWMLATYPAPAGAERVEKVTAVGVLATLLGAMTLARRRVSGRGNGVVLGLAIGWIATGLVAAGAGVDYVSPAASDLLDVRTEIEQDGWTMLYGQLRARPDLYGELVLAPRSDRLHLVTVADGDPEDPPRSTTQAVASGLAYLDRRDLARLRADRQKGVRLATNRAEIRIRSALARLLDSGTGLRVPIPGGLPSRRIYATPCRSTTTMTG